MHGISPTHEIHRSFDNLWLLWKLSPFESFFLHLLFNTKVVIKYNPAKINKVFMWNRRHYLKLSKVWLFMVSFRLWYDLIFVMIICLCYWLNDSVRELWVSFDLRFFYWLIKLLHFHFYFSNFILILSIYLYLFYFYKIINLINKI